MEHELDENGYQCKHCGMDFLAWAYADEGQCTAQLIKLTTEHMDNIVKGEN